MKPLMLSKCPLQVQKEARLLEAVAGNFDHAEPYVLKLYTYEREYDIVECTIPIDILNELWKKDYEWWVDNSSWECCHDLIYYHSKVFHPDHVLG